MEAEDFAVVQVAEALAKGGVKTVPDIVTGGTDGTGGGLVNVLLGNPIYQEHFKRAASLIASQPPTTS